MFSMTIQPGFGDTDCLGHVNNATLGHWFETARNPIIRIFVPDLNFKREEFPLILAHSDYDFVRELFFHHEVEIRTWISHIGNKSFTVFHQAWQNGLLAVTGTAVIVHYDFAKKQSKPLSESDKKALAEHFVAKEETPSEQEDGER